MFDSSIVVSINLISLDSTIALAIFLDAFSSPYLYNMSAISFSVALLSYSEALKPVVASILMSNGPLV